MATTKDVVDQLIDVNAKLDRLVEAAEEGGGGGGASGGQSGSGGGGGGLGSGVSTSALSSAAQAANQLASHATNAFESFTGLNDKANTFAGQIIQVAGMQGIQALVAGIAQAADNIDKLTTLTNIFAKLMDEIVNRTLEFASVQDRTIANFEKQVGNAALYTDQITKMTSANAKFGASLADTSEAFQTLKNSFGAFEKLSKAEQTVLGETTLQLKKLGIESSITSKNTDFLTKAQGLNVLGATNLQKSLYATANAMGIPPQKLLKEFGSATSALAVHGKEMTKIFLDMQNQAQQTGIAFDTLLGIATKLNTYEGSADVAGGVNAILQGDFINPLDLLGANEAERLRIIQQAILQSNRLLDISEKRALAEKLGLKDVADLDRIKNAELGKTTLETIKAQEAQRRMNEVTQSAIELKEKLNALFEKLAINMRPVIEFLKDVIDYYIEWSDALGRLYDQYIKGNQYFQAIANSVKSIIQSLKQFFTTFGGQSDLAKVIRGVIGLVGAWLAAKAIIKAVSAVFGGISNLLNKLFGGLPNWIKKVGGALAGGITQIGQAALKNWKGILALGAAIGLIGVGIGAAAYGIGTLVAAFAGLNKDQIDGALTAIKLLLGTMAALATAAGLASLSGANGAMAMAAFGAAMAATGYAIKLAAEGLVQMIEAVGNVIYNTSQEITNLINTLNSANAANIVAVASGLGDLAIGIGKLCFAWAACLGTDTLIKFLKDLDNTIAGLSMAGLPAIADSISKIQQSLCISSCDVLINALNQLTSKNMLNSIQALEVQLVNLGNVFNSVISSSLSDVQLLIAALNEMVTLLSKVSTTTPSKGSAAPKKTTPTPRVSPATEAAAAHRDLLRATDAGINRLFSDDGMSSRLPSQGGDVYLDGEKVGRVLKIEEKAKNAASSEISQVGSQARTFPNRFSSRYGPNMD